MIYSESLTNKLIALFGKDVVNWTKTKIRNELEGYVSLVNERILKLENSSLVKDALVLYHEVKDIEDQFMENYTIELDKIDINK
jgi:hypothetical protein